MDWTSGLDWWTGGLDWWTGLVDWTGGLDWWTGLVGWTGGLDWWTGLVDWTGGVVTGLVGGLTFLCLKSTFVLFNEISLLCGFSNDEF